MNSDPAIPEPNLLFEPVQDGYGQRLALVFGNEAPGGACPFYGRQCFHCDIGAGEGSRFTPAMNVRRVDYHQKHYSAILPEIRHLVIYNSGSVLNPREFSDASLRPVLEFGAALPACRIISLDSREAFITRGRIDYVLQCLRTDQQARMILGLETQDDEARLEGLKKKMFRPAINEVFQVVGSCGGRVGLDVNIVFGLPPFGGAAAVKEAVKTADYALELGARHRVSVDFNLHPYYPSRIARERFPGHPRASLGGALEAARQIQAGASRAAQPGKVFIGLQDEQHDQEPELRREELVRYRELVAQFNRQEVILRSSTD